MPRLGRFFREEVEDERHAWRLVPGVRRDCEPHRGRWITLAGNVSVLLATLALPTCGLAAVLAIPLGITAWVMGQADLARMRSGDMDPEGWRLTHTGRETGLVGALVAGLVVAGYVLLWLVAHPNLT
jgi:hypothetical protein